MHLRSSIAKEIRNLRSGLRFFDHSLHRLTPMLAAVVSVNGSPKSKVRSRPRLSSKARASLVLQGRYIGHLRHLKPRQKAQVRKIREAKGVRVAIERARELARS